MNHRFRMSVLAPALLLLLCLTSVSAQPLRATVSYDYGKPYYIMVNRLANNVTVFGLDERGYYTVPVRTMICTTGRAEHKTPLGTFTTGRRSEWNLMFGGTWAQYSTVISGDVLFHSVCYRQADPSTLILHYYNDLGSPGSLGCVRLQTVDAKWIYDNCPSGTRVTIYESEDPGPLGKGLRLTDALTPEQHNGWDPSDPRPENPWHTLLSTGLSYTDVKRDDWFLEAVRAVTLRGLLGEDEQDLFAPNRPMTWAEALVTVRRLAEPEAPEDAEAALAWAQGCQVLSPEVIYEPERRISRWEMVQLLYRYERFVRGLEPTNAASLEEYLDVERLSEEARAAVGWAVGNQIMNGTSSRQLVPGGEVPRAQGASLLYQYLQFLERQGESNQYEER